MLRIGTNHRQQYEKLAGSYFDQSYHLLPMAYSRIDKFLLEAARISPEFRCYKDALDFIITVREYSVRKNIIQQRVGNGTKDYFNNLLKTTLYPYQIDGIVFAAAAGRCLIADDMGLVLHPLDSPL